MTTLCARPGCSRAATVAFVFDARAQVVWLDPYRDGMPGAGVICERHADRMTPPRGWHVQDRRPVAPRLWVDRPVPGGAARPERRRTRVVAPCSATAPITLPFESESHDQAVTSVAPAAPTSDVPVDGAVPLVARDGARDLDAVLDAVLDARSPLLSRAFQPVRRVGPTPPGRYEVGTGSGA